MDKIKIPVALQLVMDDMGWFYGANDLKNGGPARTGICRNHALEDYLVLNEIGKRLNMHFLCGFTIGEWDKDNVLRGMKHATRDEDNWDRKSTIDMALAEKFKEAIESSEYIDIAFHGLMHGYWVDGENYGNPREFYSYDLPEGATERRVDYPVVPVSAEYVDEHLDAWFKIYNGWGFTKKVETIISPASLYKDKEYPDAYARKAKKYGIKYWKNLWAEHDCLTEIFEGLIFINAHQDIVDWCEMDVEPDTLADLPLFQEEGRPFAYAVMGSHWANFLRLDPKDNLKYVDKWVNYFKKQGSRFGVMLSRNIAFAASQAQYCAHTKTDFKENTLTLDISAVDKQGAIELSDEFYISIENSLTPRSCEGAELSVYEKQEGFTTYRIKRSDKEIITVRF